MAETKTTGLHDLENLGPEAIILDVRTDLEHDEKRLCCNHYHVPLDKLNPEEFIKNQCCNANVPIYLLCRSGMRAAQAAEKFKASGYGNVTIIDGGLVGCESRGEKLTGRLSYKNKACADKGPLSLERQVRIAAGSMIAAGALLGLLAHPLFGVIPLLVGSGLVFAGATDRCGLALVLTKAPWNKITNKGEEA